MEKARIEHFRPLVQSGHHTLKHLEWVQINGSGDRRCIRVTDELYVTVKIDVAAIAAYLRNNRRPVGRPVDCVVRFLWHKTLDAV